MLLFVYNTRRISIVLEYIPTIETHSPTSLKLHCETFKQHHFFELGYPTQKRFTFSVFFFLFTLTANPIEMFTFFHKLSSRIVHHFVCLDGTCNIWKRVTFQAIEIQLSSKYGQKSKSWISTLSKMWQVVEIIAAYFNHSASRNFSACIVISKLAHPPDYHLRQL